jgi:hypothetical protein
MKSSMETIVKKLFFVVLFLLAIPKISSADCWVDNSSKYHVSYVDYQTSGYVNFTISESNKLFTYIFSPSDTVALSKAKTLLSILLMAKLTGKEVTIAIPGDNPSVNLMDGTWQNYIGVGLQ